MPKLLKLKLLRGRKSSSAELPVKTTSTSKKAGIFRHPRTTAFRKTNDAKEDAAPAMIVPAITFTMSEDESSDIIRSPVSDIENQVPHFEESTSSEMAVGPDTPMSTDTKDASVGTGESDTMTFTHLEIMRNELEHMRQLAEKDKEIHALQAATESMQATHGQALSTKDAEITLIQQALTAVESALAETKQELAHVNQEQSKAIKILMETQYELYELKHSSNQGSWMSPVLDFFDFN